MVERLAMPGAISACALAKEVGVSQNTLSRWLRRAPTLTPMTTSNGGDSKHAKSPRQWTAAEKLQVILEAAAVPDAELGAFLRRKGLRESDLKAWRELMTEALGGANRPARKSDEKRIKALEQEVARKDKRIRAVNALLELQKKVREIWGDADAPTDERSGE
jgi:transposase-like protein